MKKKRLHIVSKPSRLSRLLIILLLIATQAVSDESGRLSNWNTEAEIKKPGVVITNTTPDKKTGKPRIIQPLPLVQPIADMGDTEDFDGDGIANDIDLDDDNDGILDTKECENIKNIVNGTFDTDATGWTIQPVLGSVGSGAYGISTDANFSVELSQNIGQTSQGDQITIDLLLNTLSTDVSFESQDGFDVYIGNQLIGTAPGNIGSTITPFSFSATLTTGSASTLLRVVVRHVHTNNNDLSIHDIKIRSYTPPSCADTDNDGLPNRLDLDSDGDGCPDAIEGGADFKDIELTDNNKLPGGNSGASYNGTSSSPVTKNLGNDIDGNGVPKKAGSAGQSVNISQSKFLNDCADSDRDNVSDLTDLDDDNDGILDAVEAPSCYYKSTEAAVISTVSTGLGSSNVSNVLITPGADISTMHDGKSTSVATGNHVVAAGQTNSLSSVIYSLVYPTAVRLSNVVVTGETANWGTGSEAVLEGSTDSIRYVAVSAPLSTSTGTTKTWNVTLNTGEYYKYYRIRVSKTGSTTPTFTNYEVSGTFTTTGYIQSAHPKSSCAVDTDGDGIVNTLDLDSDGDGCPDAIEGGADFKTDKLVSSSMPGGNSGSSYNGTSSTPVTTNLGNNVTNSPTTSPTLGVPTIAKAGQTVQYSQDKTLNDCTDSDGDKVGDATDLDDDNDGILDVFESTCNTEAGLPVSATVTPSENYGPVTQTIDNSGMIGSGLAAVTDGPVTTGNAWYGPDNGTTATIAYTVPAGSNVKYILLWATESSDASPGGEGPIKDFTVTVTYNNGANSFTTGTLTTEKPTGVGTPNYSQKFDFERVFTNVTKITINVLNGWYDDDDTKNDNWVSTSSVKIHNQYNVTLAEFRFGCNQILDLDTDGDGIPNRLDLDSDGDGCTDAIEGGANFIERDLENSSMPGGNSGSSYNGTSSTGVTHNLGNTVDSTNGVPIKAGSVGQIINISQNKFLNECADSDGDSVNDLTDLDDDK